MLAPAALFPAVSNHWSNLWRWVSTNNWLKGNLVAWLLQHGEGLRG